MTRSPHSTPAKPQQPPVPEAVVSRERLLLRLDAVRERRLSLICAPAGYGKTTLVADWLRSNRAPCAWLTLDTRDDQSEVFWTRVGRALQAAGVRLHAPPGAHPFLDEHADTPHLPRLLDALAAYARQWHAAHAMMLVLDDFHVLHDTALLDEINRFLDQCPPLLHCIVTSRHEPELRLARRRVAGELLEIRDADLRFTSTETAAFLAARMGLHLQPSQLRQLQDKTEGWAAALQLAGSSLQRQQDIGAHLNALVRQQGSLSDYLLEEIFCLLEPELQALLRHLACLPRFSAPLLDHCLGRQDAQDLIDRLWRRNALLLRVDDDPPVYRLHELFRDWLRQQGEPPELGAAFRGAGIRGAAIRGADFRKAAAHWLESQEQGIEALALLLDCAAWPEAEALVSRQLQAWLLQGEAHRVIAAMARFPPAWVAQSPWLEVVEAIARFNRGDFDAAEAGLVLLAERAEATDPALGLLVTFIRSQIALHTGARERTRDFIERLRAHPGLGQSPLRAWIQQMLGMDALFNGDLDAARMHLFAAIRDAERHGDLYGLSVSVSWLSPTLFFSGELAQIEHWMDFLADTLQAQDNQSPLAALVPYMHSGLLQEQNRLQEAAAALREAVLRGIENLNPINQMYFDLRNWAVAVSQGDHQEAERSLQRILFAHERGGRPWHYLFPEPIVLDAITQLARGNMQPLLTWSISHEYADLQGPSLPLVATQLLWIKGRQLLGQDADTELRELLAWSQRKGVPQCEMRCHLCMASVALLRGDSAAALAPMRAALTLSQRHGYTRSVLDEGPHVFTLIRLCSDEPTLQAEVQRLCAFDNTKAPNAEPAEGEAQANVDKGLRVRGDSDSSADAGSKADFNAGAGLGAGTGLRAAETLPRPGLEPLSRREIEILRLLQAGHSNQDLAARLGIATTTVKTHLRNIFGKLGARNRTQALAIARSQGWMGG